MGPMRNLVPRVALELLDLESEELLRNIIVEKEVDMLIISEQYQARDSPTSREISC